MRKLMGEGVFSDEGQLQMVSNVGAINFCQTLQAVFPFTPVCGKGGDKLFRCYTTVTTSIFKLSLGQEMLQCKAQRINKISHILRCLEAKCLHIFLCADLFSQL